MQAKRKIYFAIPFVVLMLVFSFALACNGGSEEAEEEEAKEETKEEVEKIQPPDKFNCGDEIIFYDPKTDNPVCFLKIHSIENWTDYTEFAAPEEGTRHLAIDIEVKNISKDTQKCNEFDNYALRDTNNFVYDNLLMVGVPKQPDFEGYELLPGDTIRGWITFSDVPEDVEIIEILAETCSCSPPAIIVVKDPLF